MQRQRGELVPIGEVVADLDGPVKAIREASPQARHHFTSLSGPAKRTPISASWRGCWRCAPCPAPTPATGKNMSV